MQLIHVDELIDSFRLGVWDLVVADIDACQRPLDGLQVFRLDALLLSIIKFNNLSQIASMDYNASKTVQMLSIFESLDLDPTHISLDAISKGDSNSDT